MGGIPPYIHPVYPPWEAYHPMYTSPVYTHHGRVVSLCTPLGIHLGIHPCYTPGYTLGIHHLLIDTHFTVGGGLSPFCPFLTGLGLFYLRVGFLPFRHFRQFLPVLTLLSRMCRVVTPGFMWVSQHSVTFLTFRPILNILSHSSPFCSSLGVLPGFLLGIVEN